MRLHVVRHMSPAGRGETRCGAGDDAVQTCICRASGIVGTFADYFTGSVLHVLEGYMGYGCCVMFACHIGLICGRGGLILVP